MIIPNVPDIQEAYKIGMLQVPEEMEFMCAFVAWRQPKVILEIGACYGASMMLWCRYAKPELAISLDSASISCGRGDVDYAKRSALFASLGVKEITADSHSETSIAKVREILGDRKIDMLVIDGDHSYEGVFADFLMYRGFLADNGFVLFHDVCDSTYHDRQACAAAHIWKQISAKLKVTVIGNGDGGGGWGIWYPWTTKFLPEVPAEPAEPIQEEAQAIPSIEVEVAAAPVVAPENVPAGEVK